VLRYLGPAVKLHDLSTEISGHPRLSPILALSSQILRATKGMGPFNSNSLCPFCQHLGPFCAGKMATDNVAQMTAKMVESVFGNHIRIPPLAPIEAPSALVSCTRDPLFVAGFYRKLTRQAFHYLHCHFRAICHGHVASRDASNRSLHLACWKLH